MELQAEWHGVQQLLNKCQQMASMNGAKERQLRQINEKAAKKGVQAYRSAVRRGALVRVRRTGPSSPRYEGGKRGPAQDIKPGTLWRSIKVIKPGNGTNVWLGPKSQVTFAKKGMKVVNNSDAWFSEIVDQGRERFGPGKNQNFGEKGIKRAALVILPYLKRMHLNFLHKQWR